MIKYIALYRKPADPEAFDERYFESHLPIVASVPGLLRAEVAKVQNVFFAGFLGDTELHLVAEMYFESAEAMKAAVQTPEWASSGANLAEIGGMELVAMFSAEVVER
ncbi:ethyl tert-butyl ether degradation protein EthD [Lentzea guizhouensis]|uniref:Ethyl tert-butyl ether degradation protein EthD n=1 Tax=Lentzea guizhouensis TaxID=1586287 RepID=A0A1B2HFL4_9PSEU|nr:EthD family reductase [Lentzea guizhouensis]ANZ36507.1 ethyl tert-butyl ether degradation protein EthD [Lentzea guizhouensis]